MIAARILVTCIIAAAVLNFLNDKVVAMCSVEEKIVQTLFMIVIIIAVVSALVAVWTL